MTDRFILEKRGHVTWLKLDRPERLNAMTRDNLEGARAFFEEREPRFTGE